MNGSKDLLSLTDLSKNDMLELFELTHSLKNNKNNDDAHASVLRGKTLGMIFEKPSTRTSISFAAGMNQLGGLPLILSAQDLQLRRGESMTDTARVLSRYVDIIMIRANRHQSLVDFARSAGVPVINGLTEREHPCQILGDCFTIIEKKLLHHIPQTRKNEWFNNISFDTLSLTYIGDGNNIANSLVVAAARLGFTCTISCPEGYEPDSSLWQWAQEHKVSEKNPISIIREPQTAVKGADIIYTDVWTSMGREKEKDERRKVFLSYQVNDALVGKAKSDAIVMHCLPAHRGEEITDSVLDGSHSAAFEQAENRLHIQKAIILKLLKVDVL
ncbi:MAG: ornithine carbamoyltransferase [Elusimicrobia bacterium]|nr:ornithine carbamoyltransferase [Elusimicrobiota bacterium]MBD3411847.1 ornithine carbamoyltransferase [Elusimicrobiota bacterium]